MQEGLHGFRDHSRDTSVNQLGSAKLRTSMASVYGCMILHKKRPASSAGNVGGRTSAACLTNITIWKRSNSDLDRQAHGYTATIDEF